MSTGAEYATLENKIKYLSLAVYFMATQPIKLELQIPGNY